MTAGHDERMRRWRLVLGAADGTGVPLAGDDARIDAALGALYDSDGSEPGPGSGGAGAGSGPGRSGLASAGQRQAGLGASAPRVARWLGDIRAFFPVSVVQVMQKDAIERLGLTRLLLEPEMLDAVEPDVHLVGTLLSLSRVLPEQARESARAVVRIVTSDLERRLAQRTRSAITGALNRASRTHRPRRPADIDWDRTIRANLRNYQPRYRTVVPERLVGYARKQQAVARHVIVCLDQSGSMASSVVYAGVFGSVLASIRSLRTSVVAFDTSVADLTEHLSDPVDVLFGTQLGGGTDINRALGYCQRLITRPASTILILVSDLFEGGDREEMLRRVADMTRAGTQVIALLALSDDGAPGYDRTMAAALAGLGVPAFACTPDSFGDLMAAAIDHRDLAEWAHRQQAPRLGRVAGPAEAWMGLDNYSTECQNKSLEACLVGEGEPMASTREWFETVEEARRRARRHLPRSVYLSLVAGAEKGITLRDNVAAFSELRFTPPHIADLPATRHLATSILGQEISLPVIASPTGVQAVHPEGEVAVARGTAEADTAMGLSSFASMPVEDVAAANPKLFFQVYWSGGKDTMLQRIDRARRAGAKALIVTLDWSFSNGRDWGSPAIPEKMDLRTIVRLAPEGLTRPGYVSQWLRAGGLPDLTVPNMAAPGEPAPTFFGFYGEWMQTPPPSWADLAWLRQQWEGPFAVKGVMRPDEARRCVDIGATAISVSNHGGNNLDGTPASIRALPAVADAVGTQLEVLLDGGIRRGGDVVKALALGARAVMIGRAYLWGLAAGGSAGVRNVFDVLRGGIDSTLLALGRRSVHDLSPDDVIVPAEFARGLSK